MSNRAAKKSANKRLRSIRDQVSALSPGTRQSLQTRIKEQRAQLGYLGQAYNDQCLMLDEMEANLDTANALLIDWIAGEPDAETRARAHLRAAGLLEKAE